MANFEFDETESLSQVTKRYSALCDKLGIGDPDRAGGRSAIETFHAALVRATSSGNQANFDKVIGIGRKQIHLVACSSRQRRGLLHAVSRLFGGN